MAAAERPRSAKRICFVGHHQEGLLHRSRPSGNFPLLGASQYAPGRHGQRLLPQVKARGGPRGAARPSLQQHTAAIEKTRCAPRLRVLPVSCWDWPEAVHSMWPQRINSTAFEFCEEIRAEALSLSHLTWDTTRNINFHIWITLLSSVEAK